MVTLPPAEFLLTPLKSRVSTLYVIASSFVQTLKCRESAQEAICVGTWWWQSCWCVSVFDSEDMLIRKVELLLNMYFYSAIFKDNCGVFNKG